MRSSRRCSAWTSRRGCSSGRRRVRRLALISRKSGSAPPPTADAPSPAGPSPQPTGKPAAPEPTSSILPVVRVAPPLQYGPNKKISDSGGAAMDDVDIDASQTNQERRYLLDPYLDWTKGEGIPIADD